MVATGMFCRQLDMVAPSSPKMIESAELMKRYPIRDNNPDLYYIYYGTLALYQHQGPIWQQWNNNLKRILPDIQIKSGSSRKLGSKSKQTPRAVVVSPVQHLPS